MPEENAGSDDWLERIVLEIHFMTQRSIFQGKHVAHLNDQVRRLIPYDIENYKIVYTEIVVNKPVAHPRHLPPFNIRVFLTHILRQLLCRLADHLNCANTCPLEDLVLYELLDRNVARGVDQKCRLFPNMPAPRF